MDDRLKQATEHANYARTIAAQRGLLLTQYETAILAAHNGGVFRCDPALITFIDMLIRDGYESFPIMTTTNVPVMIENLEEFRAMIFAKHATAMTEFNQGMAKLKKARTVSVATEV